MINKFDNFIAINAQKLSEAFADMPDISIKLQKDNITAALQDTTFCAMIIQHSFSQEIIEILGGWQAIMKLPCQELTPACFSEYSHINNIQLEHDQFADKLEAFVGIYSDRLGHNYAMLAIKLVNEAHSYWINYHSMTPLVSNRYSEMWEMGANSYAREDKGDLNSKFSPSYEVDYAGLKQIVTGEPVNDIDKIVTSPYFVAIKNQANLVAINSSLEQVQAMIRRNYVQDSYVPLHESRQELTKAIKDANYAKIVTIALPAYEQYKEFCNKFITPNAVIAYSVINDNPASTNDYKGGADTNSNTGVPYNNFPVAKKLETYLAEHKYVQLYNAAIQAKYTPK